MSSTTVTVAPVTTTITPGTVQTRFPLLLGNPTSTSIVEVSTATTTIVVSTGSSGGGGGGTGSAYPTLTVTAVSANTTLDASTHDVLLVNASGGAKTISLPPAAANANVQFTVKKTDSSANAVTLDPNSAELVDGAATYVLTDQWEAATVVCDGTGWYLI